MNPWRSPMAGPRTPIVAAVVTTKGEGSVSLRLYDPIDSWGGEWGVSAKEFVAAIDAIPDDTAEIRLLINSPGGEVWDGLAIMNALRRHPARVVAVVEGIAASTASFIAAAADELVMSKNSELFIHNAWGVAMGDAEEMQAAAADLSHTDRNIAAIYAAKSGDSAEFWLGEMQKDRWLSAEEAVSAKLADRIEGEGDAKSAKAQYDLSVFARSRHTDAMLPSSTEPGESNEKENVMAYDDLKVGLSKRLGIPEANASDDVLLAALDEVLDEQADENDASAPAAAAPVVPDGAVLVDAEQFAALTAAAAAGVEARNEQIKDRREAIVSAAIKDGRIAPKARQTWLDALERDEANATAILGTLQKNTVPVEAIGHTDGELSADDQVYAALFPDDELMKGAPRG
jgi:ATP-dependent Clp endopeptidase proteolytic subunit ClpP